MDDEFFDVEGDQPKKKKQKIKGKKKPSTKKKKPKEVKEEEGDIEQVKSTKRRLRKICQRQSLEDHQHRCSVNHVRVPAHCRLKRGRLKKRAPKIKFITMPTLPE